MNRLLQYREPDEHDNAKIVRIHPADAVHQMKNYAYQHGYAYADNHEALQDFIAVHWAYWVEE
jgi:hypothetical protein